MSARTNPGHHQRPKNARKVLQAQLSYEAYRSLRDFVETNGISISATLESLAAELEPTPIAEPTIDLDQVVARARSVDAQRRRRRGKEVEKVD